MRKHERPCRLFFLFLALCAPATVWGQFSPGPLSKAHHSLDGPTHCTSCHMTAAGERKLKCLSCHSEIRQRLAAGRGLHPTLLKQGRPDDQCAKCHSEHNGESFVPIRWDVSLDEFDHRKTGYPLEGAHTGLACNKCHNPDRISPAARKGVLMKDMRRTYLGLSRECQSCHRDEHRGQLGTACERCHTASKWKETRFDHSTAKFRLTGAHQRTACQKCHPSEPAADGHTFVKYVGIPFAQCSACHKDVHQGAFTAPCSSCHNDSAWKPARNLTTSFDHSRTKFPLLGKHAPVSCDKCHRTADFKAPIAHDQCMDCHKDIHGGQFLTHANRGECGDCHTVDGWKPATFTVSAHAKTAYPLLGRHAAVACADCHKPAGPATVYRVAFARCDNCHRDPHQGQLAANKCEDCHTVDRFQPAVFTLTRHDRTRFPLHGAHAAVSCGECHNKRPENLTVVAYRFQDLSCAGCHVDPHQGQFQVRMAAKTSGGAPAGCEACHNDRTWRDISGFDHSTTRFMLSGAHRGVDCDQCHRVTPLSTGLRLVNYSKAPIECAGCHEDIHAGQFSTVTGNAECAVCHTTGKWRPAKFDHDRTRFHLTGAHEDVPCRDCHKTLKPVNGKMVLFYKPTPLECAGCHGGKISN